LVDASGKVFGGITTPIAMRLRGKYKPMSTLHSDTGDFVVVNAGKAVFTDIK
jgi:large subunit ribosomal protein L13